MVGVGGPVVVGLMAVVTLGRSSFVDPADMALGADRRIPRGPVGGDDVAGVDFHSGEEESGLTDEHRLFGRVG